MGGGGKRMDMSLVYTMVVCVVMVVLTVLVHYESLRLISDYLLPRLRMHPRQQMVFMMLGVFAAHTLEVWLFSACLAVMDGYPLFGEFLGNKEGNLVDYIHYSAVTYTSLGLGDLYPSGNFRLLTGVEALVGLLMIGWSASFTYIAMVRFWGLHSEHDQRRKQR